MHQYTIRDIEKLLRLPRSRISTLIKSGFVTPARGARNVLLFSFQDMIVLRTAQALTDAKVPAKRITQSLKELRKNLPEAMPLSGLSISAVGDQVVVRDANGQRRADSGQYLLAFEGDPTSGSLSVIEPKASRTRPVPSAQESAEEWFDKALALELDDIEAAIQAYERAVTLDSSQLPARINLGRLLHEAGKHAESEKVYRQALTIADDDPLLLFNLGVLLEDTHREAEAIEAYQTALRHDPDLADCCYNLSLLCRKLTRPQEAIRYMSQYRRLLAVEESDRSSQ